MKTGIVVESDTSNVSSISPPKITNRSEMTFDDQSESKKGDIIMEGETNSDDKMNEAERMRDIKLNPEELTYEMEVVDEFCPSALFDAWFETFLDVRRRSGLFNMLQDRNNKELRLKKVQNMSRYFDSLINSSNDLKEVEYHCSKCNRNFTGVRDKYTHMQKHPIQVLMTCLLCKRRFLSRRRFMLHLLLHEQNNSRSVRAYQCPLSLCDKRHMSFNEIKDHIQKHKLFSCEICETYNLKDSFAFICHQRFHGSFCCFFCQKKFVYFSTFKTHFINCKALFEKRKLAERMKVLIDNPSKFYFYCNPNSDCLINPAENNQEGHPFSFLRASLSEMQSPSAG